MLFFYITIKEILPKAQNRFEKIIVCVKYNIDIKVLSPPPQVMFLNYNKIMNIIIHS